MSGCKSLMSYLTPSQKGPKSCSGGSLSGEKETGWCPILVFCFFDPRKLRKNDSWLTVEGPGVDPPAPWGFIPPAFQRATK